MVVRIESKVIRLVETETGRTLARLESPDLCDVQSATFSPDGSRLVVTTNDGPAVHVWDLRAIRKHLAGMGLDWDAPAYSDDDPANPALPPLPPLKVDYGPLPLTGDIVPGLFEELIADRKPSWRGNPTSPAFEEGWRSTTTTWLGAWQPGPDRTVTRSVP